MFMKWQYELLKKDNEDIRKEIENIKENNSLKIKELIDRENENNKKIEKYLHFEKLKTLSDIQLLQYIDELETENEILKNNANTYDNAINISKLQQENKELKRILYAIDLFTTNKIKKIKG